MLAFKHCNPLHLLLPLKQRRHIEFLTPEKGLKYLVPNIVEIQDCLFLLVIISTCHCCCLIISSFILSRREQASRIQGNKTVPQRPSSRERTVNLDIKRG